MISLFISNSNVAYTSNNGSKISLSMNPAISLDPEKKYYASAYEIDCVYCFPNIITGKNDIFTFSELVGGVQTTFTWTISQGIYSISALQEEINRATQEKCQRTNLFVLDPDESSSHVYIHFMSITGTIDCTVANCMMSIIGYPANSGILGPVLHNNDFYEGNKAQLNNIQNVYLFCFFFGNGSHENAQSKNILASLTPDVSPFSTIMYRG